MTVRRMRRTFSSRVATCTLPWSIKGSSALSLICAPEGISRSQPPLTAPSVSWAATQSDITKPWKPHSRSRTSLTSQASWVQ